MNLLALAERWGKAMGQTAVSYLQERCLHTIDKFAACTACQTICPVDAIQFGPPPAFSADSCQQCRACLPVCPVGAYTADDEVEALLKCAVRLNTPTCEIVCGLHPDMGLGDPSAAAVRVRGCLAGLGVGAYLRLVNQGFEQIVARLDACADCPWSKLQQQVEAQVTQAQHILAGWELDSVLVCATPETVVLQKRPFWHATSPPLSRRDLFRWREAEKKPVAESAANVAPNPFHERLHFLRAVKQMPPPTKSEQTTSLAGLGFALMAVNDDCTACGVCTRVCPTDTLQMETADSSYQLTFSPQICIACEVCSHVCAPNAISLRHDPTFDQVFGTAVDQIVQKGELTKCSKCHTPFAARAGTQLCPVCEFRRQNPFGSTIPPGYAANQVKSNLPIDWRIEL